MIWRYPSTFEIGSIKSPSRYLLQSSLSMIWNLQLAQEVFNHACMHYHINSIVDRFTSQPAKIILLNLASLGTLNDGCFLSYITFGEISPNMKFDRFDDLFVFLQLPLSCHFSSRKIHEYCWNQSIQQD